MLVDDFLKDLFLLTNLRLYVHVCCVWVCAPERRCRFAKNFLLVIGNRSMWVLGTEFIPSWTADMLLTTDPSPIVTGGITDKRDPFSFLFRSWHIQKVKTVSHQLYYRLVSVVIKARHCRPDHRSWYHRSALPHIFLPNSCCILAYNPLSFGSCMIYSYSS